MCRVMLKHTRNTAAMCPLELLAASLGHASRGVGAGDLRPSQVSEVGGHVRDRGAAIGGHATYFTVKGPKYRVKHRKNDEAGCG